jgi:hypothetical protein
MAINKKLIHFNKKTTFNSQKLSANASNTQYQVGGTGTVQTGAPDINYQSIVYIKDSKEIWTHGQFYATAVTWSTITGKPSFATVATSGSYTDLTNKPTIPTSLPTPNSLTFTGATTGTWNGSAAKTVNIPTYSNASTSSAGLMSASDKSKLNGIAGGAEVNQNAFSNVVVGSTTIAADSKTDTLTLTAGSNITLTPNATNDSIIISASGSSYSLPLASNNTRGGIKLSSSTQGGTPNGITTTPGRTYAVQVNSSEQAVVNVPWTDTKYTLPTASASTLGGVKVGSGLSISSGVLSTSSIPEAFLGYWYKVAGVKVGESRDLKATSNLTYKVGGSGSSTTASLIIGDVDGDSGGPGNISTGVHINANNEDGVHTITTEGKLSITSSTNDLELSSDSSSGFVKVSSYSGDIKMSNTGNGSQITFHIDEGADSYSRLQLGTSNSTGANVVQMTLGGVDKEAHFFGAVSSPGGFFDTSDARVKANVKEIDASDADKVKLVEFDRTDKEHHGYGVIAQELEKVYPEMVNTDSEGFKSVNYNELAMVKIKYLEDKVARLEALVGRLLAE